MESQHKTSHVYSQLIFGKSTLINLMKVGNLPTSTYIHMEEINLVILTHLILYKSLT